MKDERFSERRLKSARPPLDHAFDHLDGMHAVRVGGSVGEGNGLGNRAAARMLQRRIAPHQRNRRARHQRHAELPRTVVDPFRVEPVVRQVLVDVHRHRPAGHVEHAEDFLHDPHSRIHRGAEAVLRVLPMLAHEEDGVDRQFLAAKREGAGYGGIDGDPVVLGELRTEIVGRGLVHIERHHLDTRGQGAVVRCEAGEEFRDDGIGMPARTVGGAQRGNLYLGRLACSRQRCGNEQQDDRKLHAGLLSAAVHCRWKRERRQGGFWDWRSSLFTSPRRPPRPFS